MKVATIIEIKAGFVHKAVDFKVDKQYPSRTELQETFRKLEENAMTVACLENQCDEFGYAVLLCKHAEWKQYHADKQTQAADEAAQLAGAPTYQEVGPDDASIPALPVFPNPGRFVLVDTWSDKERAINKLLHEQEADAFLLASNVDKALILCIREIFNESIWADMNRGTTIGTSSLRNRHNIREVRDHLETKYNRHRPVDIQTIMETFSKDVDTGQPLEKYFERQQQCQTLLADDTDEPIREASMKRTAIGHFLRIPHLTRVVREYESDIDPDGTGSWEDLRKHFIAKNMEYVDDQATLSSAGIANSAEVDEELVTMKYEMANMAEKTQALEEALVTMAQFMKDSKKAPAPAPSPSPAPAPAPVSMEQQWAAFMASQQRKEAPSKEQSAIDKAVARALGDRATNQVGGSKKKKPSKRCTWYCDSHGCNFSHNSDQCKGKLAGHSDTATFSNPSPQGKMWNKDIYTGPGCPPCNIT